MNRLTELYKLNSKHEYFISKNDNIYDSMQKLGHLEDIEEELGIDLITLFIAVKNGIWATFVDKFGKTVILESTKLILLNDLTGFDCEFADGDERVLFFKDYNKTWALTKEELENESTKL